MKREANISLMDLLTEGWRMGWTDGWIDIKDKLEGTFIVLWKTLLIAPSVKLENECVFSKLTCCTPSHRLGQAHRIVLINVKSS